MIEENTLCLLTVFFFRLSRLSLNLGRYKTYTMLLVKIKVIVFPVKYYLSCILNTQLNNLPKT